MEKGSVLSGVGERHTRPPLWALHATERLLQQKRRPTSFLARALNSPGTGSAQIAYKVGCKYIKLYCIDRNAEFQAAAKKAQRNVSSPAVLAITHGVGGLLSSFQQSGDQDIERVKYIKVT